MEHARRRRESWRRCRAQASVDMIEAREPNCCTTEIADCELPFGVGFRLLSTAQ